MAQRKAGWPTDVKRWPSTAKMRALWNAGLTLDEIAEYVLSAGDGWSEPPDRSSVQKYFARMGLERRPTLPSAKALIPWQVKTEHSRHRYRHMLNAEARSREGKELSDSQQRLLGQMHNLLFGRGNLLVIDYDREHGWCLRDWEEGDEDIIRAPRTAGSLRKDVQAELRDATSDRNLAEIALRDGVRPEVLENAGRDKAADLLRVLKAAAGEPDPEEAGAEVTVLEPASRSEATHSVRSTGTPSAPTALASKRRRAAQA